MLWRTGDNEIFIKVVFWGPLGSGKRTTLEQLSGRKSILGESLRFAPLPPKGEFDLGSNLEIIPTDRDSAETFSFVPLRLEMPKGPNLRFLVFAVHSECNGPALAAMGDADAFILVADSQLTAINSNLVAAKKLQALLGERQGKPCPVILQLNKRDLPNTVTSDEFRAMLPWTMDHVESVALSGTGVRDTIRAVIRNLNFSTAQQV
jgi:signal recognition particle receptor subunit beta